MELGILGYDQSIYRMNRATLSSAEAVLAVIATGGFGAAARELGVAQSTVSRRIALLEERLGGAVLFSRTSRVVRPTETGLRYAEAVRSALNVLGAAEQTILAGASVPTGRFRVTVASALGRAWLTPVMAQLSDQYLDLRFDVDFEDRYVDVLEEGYDLGLRLSPPDRSGLAGEIIGRSPLHLCAAPAYAKRWGLPTRPQDLTHHRCIVMRTYAPRTRWRFGAPDGPVEVQIDPSHTVNDITALCALVSMGAGISILPDYLARPLISDGQLLAIMPDFTLPNLKIHAVYPHDRKSLPAIRATLDAIRQVWPS